MADQANNVELLVGGNAYTGWKSVIVERSIEQLAGSFELSVSEVAPNGDAAAALYDGVAASVRVNGQTVITGFVDDLDISHSATEHTITVRGRDKAGDLVDCSALHASGAWSNRDMLSIATDLLKDYGIGITVDAELGEKFAKWNIEPGESVFENIDKMARHRGVLVISDGLGGIVFTQPGATTLDTSLVLGKNILAGRLTRSMQQRFKDYSILGERQRDDNNEPVSTKPRGMATDGYVKRHRPCVCVYEDANATIKTLKDRALWQSRVNAARAQRAIVTVQGWSYGAAVWPINQQVTVTNKLLRLDNETLLIAGARYMLDQQGTRTELSLLPRNAFLVDKEPSEVTQ